MFIQSWNTDLSYSVYIFTWHLLFHVLMTILMNVHLPIFSLLSFCLFCIYPAVCRHTMVSLSSFFMLHLSYLSLKNGFIFHISHFKRPLQSCQIQSLLPAKPSDWMKTLIHRLFFYIQIHIIQNMERRSNIREQRLVFPNIIIIIIVIILISEKSEIKHTNKSMTAQFDSNL